MPLRIVEGQRAPAAEAALALSAAAALAERIREAAERAHGVAAFASPATVDRVREALVLLERASLALDANDQDRDGEDVAPKDGGEDSRA